MRTFSVILALTLIVTPLCVVADSIPEDKIDKQKLFRGDLKRFSKPAEIQFVELVKNTPEYEAIKKESLKSADARYWILMTQAQERVTRSIVRVAREKQFDVVCEKGYLKSLGVEAKDITELIEEDLTGKSDSGSASGDKKPGKRSLSESDIEELKSKLKVQLLEE